MDPENGLWMKLSDELPDNPALHRQMLAYLSDFLLMETALQVHPMSREQWRQLQTGSLDHSIWFHGDCRADQWLLYHVDSPVSAAARGFNRGSFYSRSGKLIASTAQEGLMRLRGDESAQV